MKTKLLTGGNGSTKVHRVALERPIVNGQVLNSGDGESKSHGRESIKLNSIRYFRFYTANSVSGSILHREMKRRKLEKLVKDDVEKNSSLFLSAFPGLPRQVILDMEWVILHL